MKPAGGLQKDGLIGLRVGRGLLQSGSFSNVICHGTHQTLVVSRGIGKPDPEGHRATTLVALYLALVR